MKSIEKLEFNDSSKIFLIAALAVHAAVLASGVLFAVENADELNTFPVQQVSSSNHFLDAVTSNQ